MSFKSFPTMRRLKELFNYDKESGHFVRAVSKKGNQAGSVAGCIDSLGYIRINVDGKAYRAHRLVWIYTHGYAPDVIDHINGNRSDNRLVNLRQANQRINNQNRHAPSKSMSGFAGVSKSRDAWRAHITDRKKQIYLGTYKTPEAAHLAYLQAKRQLHEGAPA